MFPVDLETFLEVNWLRSVSTNVKTTLNLDGKAKTSTKLPIVVPIMNVCLVTKSFPLCSGGYLALWTPDNCHQASDV